MAVLGKARGAAGLCLVFLMHLAGCDDGTYGDPFSRRLLDTPVLLTGVIIEVADGGEPALGDLKLRSTGALNATARFDEEGSLVTLSGCREGCGPGSPEVSLLVVPVIEWSDESLGVELSAVGGALGVSSSLPEGEYTIVSTVPRLVESTAALFIFDVEAEVDRRAAEGTSVRFSVVTRWTVASPEMLHADFRVQTPRDDIGLFTATRSAEPKTLRWQLDEPLHFFLKSVPAEHREAFRAGLEAWNTLSQATLGRDIVSYEFIPAGDSRQTALVTGDIRANVIEWDLRNVATYGGLAASHADPRTGEIFSSSILVQGPGIMDLYRDWFDIVPLSDVEGRERKLLALRSRHAPKPRAIQAAPKLRLGPLELAGDEGCSRMEDRVTYFFEDRPPEVAFEDYMFGYFRAMVSHEVGHALGFGHNFMGSLSDDGGDNPSSTTMEYVWRGARYLGPLGAYDAAALRFAYGGEAVPANEVPAYCVETVNVAHPTRNAECSAWDGQTDPFGYFVGQVRRAVERAVRFEAVGQPPLWTLDSLRGPLNRNLQGALFYATSAPQHAEDWVRFPGPDRPTEPAAIRRFVVEAVEAVVCGDWVSNHLEASFSMNRAAGEAGAQAWAVMVADLQRTYSTLELSGNACDPRERLSFDF